MPCYKPLDAYYGRKINPKTGKRPLVFNLDLSLVPVRIPVPCGRCIGCRLDRSLQWAIRCMHEASLYENNCFITLTFDDKHLPKDGSLKVSDFQKFMKKLRKKYEPKTIRFFHCGEYGEKFKRPHHHACLFNHDFPDKVLIKEVNGVKLYTSKTLKELWPDGFNTIGEVTFESSAYIARYVLKKWSKECQTPEELYSRMKQFSDADLRKNYYKGKKEEYLTMSRKPGIGSAWYEKYKKDLYPSGFVVVNKFKTKIPKYYETKYSIDNPLNFALLKGERMLGAQLNPNNSQQRLDIREEFKKLITKGLSRGYENNDTENLCHS